jgi:hypothetical protein
MGRDDRLSTKYLPGRCGQSAAMPRLERAAVTFRRPPAERVLRHLLETRCLERGDGRSLIVTRLGKAWFDKLGLDADASSVERRAPALLISGA